MKMFVYLLDLKPDEKGIAEYLEAHKNVEPAIRERTNECGVIWTQVRRKGNRLVQIVLTNDEFDEDNFNKVLAADPACARWNTEMMEYQMPVPAASEGDWWTETEVVYDNQKWENA